MKSARLILLLLFSSFSFVLSSAQNVNERVKTSKITILGMGDSITEGGGDSFTYLLPLWEKLCKNRYEVEFMGPKYQKYPQIRLGHAGYSGKNVEFLESIADSVYRQYPADIVLMHAGHNHFIEEKPIFGMIEAYKSIIKKLKSINPNVTILIAQVIHSGKLPKYSYIPDLNKEIVRMVREMNDSTIMSVDHSQTFDWRKHTIADKVHPNKEGAEVMAQVWYEALKKILDTSLSSPWGVAAHPTSTLEWAHIDEEMKYMREGGIKWVREDFRYSYICAEKDTFHFSRYDSLLDVTHKNGVTVLPILQAYDSEIGKIHPELVPMYKHLEEWRIFVRETVKRYHHKMKYWEIWNEQDGGFWKPAPDASQYVPLLKIAYEEIKNINPNLKVVLGGLCSWNADYLKDVYAAGAKGYFDVVAVHPYNYGPDVNRMMKRKHKEFMNIMANNGDSGLPIWITECGWTSYSSELMEQKPLFMLDAISFALKEIGKEVANVKIGVAVSPRVNNLDEVDLHRKWLPGIELEAIPFDKLQTLTPEECPVLIGAEGIYIDEPLLVPLREYVKKGGLLLAVNRAPFYTVRYQDSKGVWQLQDRSWVTYPFFRMNYEAFWTQKVPQYTKQVKISKVAQKGGLPQVQDIYVDRYLDGKEMKAGDRYFPIIEAYDGENYIGDGMALYTYKDWKGAVLMSTISVETGYSEAEQANLLQRVFLTYLSLGVEKVFWYDLHNDGILKGEREHNFGLLNHDFSPKLPYEAYRKLTAVLGNAPAFLKRIKGENPDIWALLFRNNDVGKEMLAIWSVSKQAEVELVKDGILTDKMIIDKEVRFIPIMKDVMVKF